MASSLHIQQQQQQQHQQQHHALGGGGGSSSSANGPTLPEPPALDAAGRQAAIDSFARRGLTLPSYIAGSQPSALRERSLLLRPAHGPSAAASAGSGGGGGAHGPGGGGGGGGGTSHTVPSASATNPGTGVLALSWSPDGRRLASCGTTTVSPAGGPPPPAAQSASTAAAIAAVSEEKTVIRIWTPEFSVDARSTVELRGHTDHVEQVAFSPTSLDVLASTGWDKTVKMWDTRAAGTSGGDSRPGNGRPSSKPVLNIPTRSRNLNMQFHPSGHYVAIGDRIDDVTLFDIRTGKELGYISKDAPFQINRFTWSASGDLFFMTCGNGEIRILDSRSLSTLSAGNDSSELPKKTPGGDVLDWPLLHTIFAHTSIAHNVQLDPLGRALLTSGTDACVNLFSTASPYSATAFASMRYDDDQDDDEHPHANGQANGSHSNGSLLNPPAQRAFLPPDYTLMHSFTEFETLAHAVGFSADGELWAAGGDQGWVEVASTAAPHASLIRIPYPLGSIKALAFNPAASHPGRAHVLAFGGEESNEAIRSFALANSGGNPESGPSMAALGAARSHSAGGTIRVVGLKGPS